MSQRAQRLYPMGWGHRGDKKSVWGSNARDELFDLKFSVLGTLARNALKTHKAAGR